MARGGRRSGPLSHARRQDELQVDAKSERAPLVLPTSCSESLSMIAYTSFLLLDDHL